MPNLARSMFLEARHALCWMAVVWGVIGGELAHPLIHRHCDHGAGTVTAACPHRGEVCTAHRHRRPPATTSWTSVCAFCEWKTTCACKAILATAVHIAAAPADAPPRPEPSLPEIAPLLPAADARAPPCCR